MTRITNTDQIVLLVRSQLQRQQRIRRTDSKEKAQQSSEQTADQLQAIAQLSSLPEDQQGRALIQGLLSQQFGDELVNDPSFQSVIEAVRSALASDEKSQALLSAALRELRD